MHGHLNVKYVTNTQFYGIRPVGITIFCADIRTYMMRLTFAFRSCFASKNNCCRHTVCCVQDRIHGGEDG